MICGAKILWLATKIKIVTAEYIYTLYYVIFPRYICRVPTLYYIIYILIKVPTYTERGERKYYTKDEQNIIYIICHGHNNMCFVRLGVAQ